jgi:hypothetical protein
MKLLERIKEWLNNPHQELPADFTPETEKYHREEKDKPKIVSLISFRW